MDSDLSQFLMTVVTFTMAMTPLLANLGRKIKGQLYTKSVLRDNKIRREIDEISKHVIVIGFTKVGRIVSYILRKRGLNYVVLESNHRVVHIEKNNGYDIYYGDALNADILRYIGIEKAESVIVALEDEVACIKITRFIHQNFPRTTVVTKSETLNNAERFKKVGASMVVAKNLETGVQLSKVALSSVGVGASEIDSALKAFREINSEIIKDVILYDENEVSGTIFEKES